MQIPYDQDEGVDVQMTPLIDCVFLLLIFFLVASTLKKLDQQLEVDLPQAAAAVTMQTPEDATIIGIDAQGEFYLSATPVGRAILFDRLNELSMGDKESFIRIDADRAAPSAVLVEVLSQLRQRNLTNVQIKTKDLP